jgi:hypothetical protein
MLNKNFKKLKIPTDVIIMINPPMNEPIAIAKNDLFQSKPRNQLRMVAV